MLNFGFFRPGNFLIIAGVTLAVMFLMSQAKNALDGSRAGGTGPANPAPANPLSNQ